MNLRWTCNINVVPNTEERLVYELDALHLSTMITIIDSITENQPKDNITNYYIQRFRKERRQEFLEACNSMNIPSPTAYITGRNLEDAKRSMMTEYSSFLNALNIVS